MKSNWEYMLTTRGEEVLRDFYEKMFVVVTDDEFETLKRCTIKSINKKGLESDGTYLMNEGKSAPIKLKLGVEIMISEEYDGLDEDYIISLDEAKDIAKDAASLEGHGVLNSTGYHTIAKKNGYTIAVDIFKECDEDAPDNEYFGICMSPEYGGVSWYFTDNLDVNTLALKIVDIATQCVKNVDDSIKEMFPDWWHMEKGEWSDHGRIINTAGADMVEIGLYREDADGSLTLQIFVNDDVVVCEQVSI